MLRQRAPGGRTSGRLDVQSGSRVVRIAVACIALAIWFVAVPVRAEQLFPGDYFSSYKRAAEQGERRAQYLLGLRYERGVPGEPDYVAAAHWYAKAAAQGMHLAAFRLALIYQYGRGVTRDPSLAAKWYTKAAEEGLPEAQFNLGYLYERGIGVAVDGKASAVWYRRAALQGVREAYRHLGMLYATGHSIDRDDAKALFWLSLVDSNPEVERIRDLVRERGGPAAVEAARNLREEWNAQQR